MRKYKSVIINGKGILKSAGLFMVGAIVTLSSLTALEKRFSGEEMAEKIINENIAVTSTFEFCGQTYKEQIGIWLKELFLGYDPKNSASILRGTLPLYKKTETFEKWEEEPFEDKYEVKNKNKTVKEINIPLENQAPIKEINAQQKLGENMVAAVGNETSYSIDINGMFLSEPKINMSLDGPKVLITHTHATESYARDGATVYDVTEGDRSDNISENVVAVGERLCGVLNGRGIETVHDKILHDRPSFNGSYAHSLSTVEEYIKKHPSIQIVLDIHRDSIVYDDKTKAKTVTEINGKDAAQLMFVVGTDEKGLYNPDWRDNLTAAIHFQHEITEKYPSLMRHINLRKERFNGHTSKASMIVEVGTSGNSLNEAIYGIELMGECIADYLKRM